MPLFSYKLKQIDLKLEINKEETSFRVINPPEKKTNWVSITKAFFVDPEKEITKAIGAPLKKPLPMATNSTGWTLDQLEKLANTEAVEDLVLSFSTERFLSFLAAMYPRGIGYEMATSFKFSLAEKYSRRKPILSDSKTNLKIVFLQNTNFHDIKFNDPEVDKNKIVFPRNYPYKKSLLTDVYLNDQFRWNCLFMFVVSYRNERGTRKPWTIWEEVDMKPKRSVVFVDKLDDVFYVQPRDLGTGEGVEFTSYFNGSHLRNERWTRFHEGSRFDRFLPIDKEKRVCKEVNSSETVVKEFRTSILDYHYSQQKKFSDLFCTICDGFTKKHWTNFEIALSMLMILTDMILGSSLTFDVSKVSKDKMRIYNALESVPVGSRTWSNLKATGIDLCKMVHFSLHYYEEEDKGIHVMESLYWACLTVVKKGYYTMNKIYSEKYNGYKESEDLIERDFPFNLGRTQSRRDIVEAIFGTNKSKQIWGLYCWLQNSDLKKYPNLEYEVWKMIPVEELQ